MSILRPSVRRPSYGHRPDPCSGSYCRLDERPEPKEVTMDSLLKNKPQKKKMIRVNGEEIPMEFDK